MNTTITTTAVVALIAAGIDLGEKFPNGLTIVPDTAPTSLAEKQADAEIAHAAAVEARAEARTELPVLTRSAWKTLRTTKKGAVKAKFAGLTREQAHEAGLTPGYRLPTGEMRAALRAQA